MIKYLTNNFSIINLYRKPSIKSEVVTQMIFGESFSILKKTRKWLKIKIKEDNYKGYIKCYDESRRSGKHSSVEKWILQNARNAECHQFGGWGKCYK